jgi:hypothetical protein
MCIFELLPLMKDGVRGIDRKPRRPKRIGDAHISRRKFTHKSISRF